MDQQDTGIFSHIFGQGFQQIGCQLFGGYCYIGLQYTKPNQPDTLESCFRRGCEKVNVQHTAVLLCY